MTEPIDDTSDDEVADLADLPDDVATGDPDDESGLEDDPEASEVDIPDTED